MDERTRREQCPLDCGPDCEMTCPMAVVVLIDVDVLMRIPRSPAPA